MTRNRTFLHEWDFIEEVTAELKLKPCFTRTLNFLRTNINHILMILKPVTVLIFATIISTELKELLRPPKRKQVQGRKHLSCNLKLDVFL